MSAYQRNVLVGVVVLVGLGMLAWMVLTFANKAASYFLTSGVKIQLVAKRADGVADGSPITYKGVNVGRVTGVRRGPSTEDGEDIIIDALIDTHPPLPANLHGRIRQTSVLGGTSAIALEPIPRDPKAATRSSSTDAPAELAEGQPPLKAEYVPDISSLGDSVRELTASIQDVIGDPEVKDNIKLSLGNIRQATESAARLGRRLEKLSESLEKTTEEANGTMGDVRVTVKDARAEIRRMSDNLNQRLEQLALSLEHVQSVTRKIDEGEGTAGRLVNDPKLYDSLADTAAELNLMVKDMRRLIQQWEQEGIIKL